MTVTILRLSDFVSPNSFPDGKDPETFGTPTWYVVHVLAYHAQDCDALSQVAETLSRVLMCIYCRVSMQVFLTVYDPRDFCGRWPEFWNRMHNWVNEKLGKEVWTLAANRHDYGHVLMIDWRRFEQSVVTVLNMLRDHVRPFTDSKTGKPDLYQRDYVVAREFQDAAIALVRAVLVLFCNNTQGSTVSRSFARRMAALLPSSDALSQKVFALTL